MPTGIKVALIVVAMLLIGFAWMLGGKDWGQGVAIAVCAFLFFGTIGPFLDTLRPKPPTVVVRIGIKSKDDELEFHWLSKVMNLPIVPRIGDYVQLTFDRPSKVESVLIGESQSIQVHCGEIVVTQSNFETMVSKFKDDGWR